MKKFLLSCSALALAASGFAQATGSLEKPLTVDEFLAEGVPESPVADTYVQGYIVGYIDGMTLSTGARFEIDANVVDTNILIAASSSEDMVEKCIPVQLPSGDVRKALGLQSNPQNIYHQVILKGSHEKYFGANGLKSISQYQWVGDAPEAGETGTLGSASAPLTVTELMSHETIGTQYAYVTGYIVGCVKNGGLSVDDAVFNATEDPSNTNILLAASADCTDIAQCLTVQVSDYDVRDALCLQKAPGNLGKQVTIYGTYEKYFGVKGVKGVAKFSFGDKLEEGGSSNTNGAIYSGLKDNGDDWTIDEVLPEGLSYVWNWDSTYGMKASAYVSGTKYDVESTLISPVINLDGYTDIKVTLEQNGNYFGGHYDTQAISKIREENGEWEVLTYAPVPEGNSWTWVNSEADINKYAGKKIQLGFTYISTTTDAPTWEIKNLNVLGTSTSGVEAIDAENSNAIYFDLQGLKVANPENGLFIKVVNGKASKVLIRK